MFSSLSFNRSGYHDWKQCSYWNPIQLIPSLSFHDRSRDAIAILGRSHKHAFWPSPDFTHNNLALLNEIRNGLWCQCSFEQNLTKPSQLDLLKSLYSTTSMLSQWYRINISMFDNVKNGREQKLQFLNHSEVSNKYKNVKTQRFEQV